MKEGCLILDVAHGKSTPSKHSPDLVFLEYDWSRERVKDIYKALMDFKLPFDYYAPFLSWREEPGLRKRVNVYNERAEVYTDTIMLSLHVDKFKGEWWDGTGFSFFTNRQENKADELAEVMAKVWEKELPDERIRRNRPGDVSKDENFTVIWGYNRSGVHVPIEYHGILIENLFMDNRADVYGKLMDDKWNTRLVDTYLVAIMELFEHLGYMINI